MATEGTRHERKGDTKAPHLSWMDKTERLCIHTCGSRKHQGNWTGLLHFDDG